MSEWQPIDTAPVATRLLLWWRPVDDNHWASAVVIGSIPSNHDGELGDTWWNDQTGWHQDIRHITHWMPLPEPPK